MLENLTDFYALLQAGNGLIAADWLEETCDEYLTEIARQLRRSEGKWLADRLYYGKSFLCWHCKLQNGYGYRFTQLERNLFIKSELLIWCSDCVNKFCELKMPLQHRWKVQAI